MSTPTKADLAARISELEAEIERLNGQREALEHSIRDLELSAEAIQDCRAILSDIGHRGTYFDDVVRAAVQELKALRYDNERFQRLRESTWSSIPKEAKGEERPKRSKAEEFGVRAWFALAG